MNMETLEFILHADGRVEEKVTGITGKSCAEVTAAIEAELGIVFSTEATSEYFAQATQAAQVSNQTPNQIAVQVTFSNW